MSHSEEDASPPRMRSIHPSVAKDKNRVYFDICFSKPCGCGTRKLNLSTSVKKINASPSQLQTDLNKKAIEKAAHHVSKKRTRGAHSKCGLDVKLFDNVALWSRAFVELNLELEQNGLSYQNKALQNYKVAEARREASSVKSWNEGLQFNLEDKNERNKKDFAVGEVFKALAVGSGNEIAKASDILGMVASKNAERSADLDGDSFLTEQWIKRAKLTEGMVNRAKACLQGMKHNKWTKEKLRVATGFCAMVLPTGSDAEAIECCKLLELNHKSKYVESGRRNHAAFDEFLSSDQHLSPGDRVSCQDGYGSLVALDLQNNKAVISLLPWNHQVTYKPISSAWLKRFELILDKYGREERSDTTPNYITDIIEHFHRTHNHVSPNKSDMAKRRHKVFSRQIEEAPRIYRYQSWNELWKSFQELHPDISNQIRNDNQPNECPMIIRRAATWEMVKGKDSSCLCTNCEGLTALKRGIAAALKNIDKIIARHGDDNESIGSRVGGRGRSKAELLEHLKKVREILRSESKYEMCLKCLPCVTSGKLEDAKVTCMRGGCDVCGFGRLWSNRLRKSVMKREMSRNGNDFTEHFRTDSPLASPEWAAKIQWRYYTYKTRPKVADHARSTRSDDDYLPKKSSTSRNLCLETKEGTLVDFLDELKRLIASHIEHRNLVSIEQRSKKDFDRNIRPQVIERNIDFSENGTIKNADEVQSEYYSKKQFTLFVSIVSWLLADRWDEVDGTLNEDDEVTVNGEFVGQPINLQSFWAKVRRHVGNNSYEVVDGEGNSSNHHRQHLRLRVKHTVAFGHISDDKIHDRYAMQHYTDTELQYLKRYIKDNFPHDVPDGGDIKTLFQHSDNAGQHFKSTGSINYFSSLVEGRGGEKEFSFVYSFGAPGHGKGKWDGIGGGWKKRASNMQTSAKTRSEGIPGVPAGHITEVHDVHAALAAHYSDPSNRRQRRNAVNHIHFFLHKTDAKAIRRPDETFDTLNDIQRNYQFSVSNVGVVHMREQSCWCLQCLAELTHGSFGWEPRHVVNECTSSKDVNTEVFTFCRETCHKLTGPGVAQRNRLTAANRNAMASNLKHGEWVIFDSNDSNQPLWIGRAFSKNDDNFGGKCTWTNNTGGKRRFDGDLVIDKGEVAVNVLWYEKIEPSWQYHVSREHTRPILQSSRYIIAADFEMSRIVGVSNQVPRNRVTRDNQILEQTHTDWYEREYDLVYLLDKSLREDALSKCGLWKMM